MELFTTIFSIILGIGLVVGIGAIIVMVGVILPRILLRDI